MKKGQLYELLDEAGIPYDRRWTMEQLELIYREHCLLEEAEKRAAFNSMADMGKAFEDFCVKADQFANNRTEKVDAHARRVQRFIHKIRSHYRSSRLND